MNNTKWDEIFRAFYQHQIVVDAGSEEQIFFRVISTNPVLEISSFWDCDWAHFGSLFKFYEDIESLQIQYSEYNRSFVLDTLRTIHVPGEIDGDIVTVFGYNANCEYL